MLLAKSFKIGNEEQLVVEGFPFSVLCVQWPIRILAQRNEPITLTLVSNRAARYRVFLLAMNQKGQVVRIPQSGISIEFSIGGEVQMLRFAADEPVTLRHFEEVCDDIAT